MWHLNLYNKLSLDSSISSDDVNMGIPGYNLVRADPQTNAKRGGVCIYFQNLFL